MPGSERGTPPLVIAIDGPAASGKGTLAERLSRALGLARLDTGLLYRLVGWRALEAGADLADETEVTKVAEGVDESGLEAALADPRLRGDTVAQAASKVSAMPRVRAAILDLQRDFAARPPGAVLDGRDIGTVVCPDAPVKLFVVADLPTRARRRHAELVGRGESVTLEAVEADLAARDARDSGRAISPLRQAEDAVLIDSSALTPEEVLAQALAVVAEHTGVRPR